MGATMLTGLCSWPCFLVYSSRDRETTSTPRSIECPESLVYKKRETRKSGTFYAVRNVCRRAVPGKWFKMQEEKEQVGMEYGMGMETLGR